MFAESGGGEDGLSREMLELDMELDADLGIDSIKRVEILSALQERLPEAPTIKPEHLGTLPAAARRGVPGCQPVVV